MMKKNKLLLFTLLTTVFIALVTPLAFAGGPQTATLSVDPSTGIMEYPTYAINIIISEVTYLWGVNFRLLFNDPDDFLEFASVEAGNLMPGAIVEVGEFTNYINVLVKTSSPPDHTTTVNGSGSVAKITFNLKETAEVGMTSDLILPVGPTSATAILPDGNPQIIDITDTYSGSVEVGLLITDLNINVPATAKVDTPTTMSAALEDGVGNPVEGSTIDFYVRSDTVWNPRGSDETDGSGVASIDYAFNSVGEFDVKAEFKGSTKYAPNSDTDTILVLSMGTSLTIDVLATAKVDVPITMSATLKDEEASPVEGEIVDFYVRSDTVWNKIGLGLTDASGVASIDYSFTSVGEFGVKAEFSGSTIYAGSSDTDVVLVLSIETTLTIDVPATAKVNILVTMSATLKDGVGNPVEGSTIDFYVRSDTVWNPIGSDDTDGSGVASIDYAFNSVGEFDVKAEFSGSEIYAGSSDTGTVLVTWSESTLTLTVSPPVVKVDETVTMSATLEDKDSGNPLHNYIIYFYIYADDEWKPVGDESTNLDGVASINYAPTEAGTFEVNATFWGSLEYTSSSDTDTVLVLSIETSLRIDVPATAKVDTPITMSATLKDEEASPLEGEIVDFYIRSDTVWNKIGSDETDASGIASISHTPTDAGAFQIKAVYGGSTIYAESSDTEMLTVSLLTTTLNLDAPTSARVEDTITLVATLKDEDGNPVADSAVDYYISSGAGWNTIGFAPTDTSGVASMDYTSTEAGTFKLKAVYEGTQKYAGSSSEEVTLEVSAEHPLSFLLDAKLTVLDILFWAVIIVSFSTLVFGYKWKKRKREK